MGKRTEPPLHKPTEKIGTNTSNISNTNNTQATHKQHTSNTQTTHKQHKQQLRQRLTTIQKSTTNPRPSPKTAAVVDRERRHMSVSAPAVEDAGDALEPGLSSGPDMGACRNILILSFTKVGEDMDSTCMLSLNTLSSTHTHTHTPSHFHSHAHTCTHSHIHTHAHTLFPLTM